MDQHKGKLHPNAGNVSRLTPQSTQQPLPYEKAASGNNKTTSLHPTMSLPKAAPSVPERVTIQELVDVPSQRQSSQVSINRQESNPISFVDGSSWINHSKPRDWGQRTPRKSRTFNTSTKPIHVPEIRESALKKYQQIPLNQPSTSTKGFLAWPKADLPHVASGSGQELDDIRLQLNCHIAYDKEMEVFEIFSAGKDGISGKEAVESALVGVRKKLQQKGSSRSDTLKIFLARLPEDHTLRLIREYAKDHKLVTGLDFEQSDALIRLRQVDGAHIPTNWPIWSKRLESVQIDVFRLAMLDRLSELQSMCESVHLRVRVGMCVFKNYLWESNRIRDLPIIAFVESFEHDKTDAILCSINDDARLMENILQREDVLDLMNVEPHYEMLFDVAGKGESKATHQLHISASHQKGSVLHERNWRKFIDRDRVGQALEVFMVKFGGEQSWELRVDAAPRVSIPGDEERDFAASVQLNVLDAVIDISAYHGLCFNFRPNNNIRMIKQKIIWRTNLQSNSRWVVEIAKYDSFIRNQTGSAWIAAGGSRWDISMYHRKWNMASALAASQDSDKTISTLLSPDQDYLAADEAVKDFCQTMTQVSDSLSFWPCSVVE